MNCQDYEIALGDYVDGTLDEHSRLEFETHLASCDRCRAVVTDLGVLRRATLALEPALPAPQVWTKLSSAFEAESSSTVRRWGFAWRTLAASLMTVMLVATLTWIGRGLAPIKAPSGQLASPATSQVEPI